MNASIRRRNNEGGQPPSPLVARPSASHIAGLLAIAVSITTVAASLVAAPAQAAQFTNAGPGTIINAGAADAVPGSYIVVLKSTDKATDVAKTYGSSPKFVYTERSLPLDNKYHYANIASTG